MKKKILCLIDGLSYGGAERQLIGLAYLLQCKGYEVELCSYLKRDFYNNLIDSYSLNTVCLDIKGGKFAKFMAIKKHIKQGSFNWVISFKDGATSSTCLLKLLGVKFKLIVSERNTTQILNLHEIIKFWLYRYADYIVPNSYSQEAFIRRHFPFLTKKVFTITNYTDIDCFVPVNREIKNKKEIVVVARIAQQKNIIRFLKVVRQLKDMRLNFHVKWYGSVSTNEEDYQKECMSLYQTLGISDMMVFHSATKDIREVYQNADIFCLPSIYEGYSNVICEAMSCGKPILCSRVCDNLHIIQEGKNGLMFDPLDENDMLSVIKEMLSYDHERLIQMGRESRNISINKFSSESFVGKYIQLIENDKKLRN